MARLKTARPRIASGRPRIDNSVTDAKRYEAARRAEADWRRWYKTKEWRALRELVLNRDRWTCVQTGVLLSGAHPAPNAPVVDHRRPHRGDRVRFFDPGNCQAVSKLWHDTVKQAVERASEAPGRAQVHPDWLGRSLVPVVLVCGAPGSGKSTLVEARRRPGDLVVDLDLFGSMLSGSDLHGWDRGRWLGPALRARNAVLAQLGRRADWPCVWLVVSEPRVEWRDWWRRRLGVAEVVVLETPAEECRRRMGGRSAEALAAVGSWWRDYRPDGRDEIVAWPQGEGGANP